MDKIERKKVKNISYFTYNSLDVSILELNNCYSKFEKVI